jgi:D-isomer specific 2-hydroxyacid dehydrogenase, catalytic domain/D-isomer specific 2-hydroxyacid dehydrogenase, NAD binding domain
MAAKPEVILMGPLKPLVVRGLEAVCTVHKTAETKDHDAFYAAHAGVGAIAISATAEMISGAFMSRFPKLAIISSFGVGYDHIDAKWAGAHGITVTNTPEVLTEEVADTALGLLLCTVRELPQSDRYVRAGKWAEKGFPLSKATLRNRTVGMVGMGAIGKAIARRLDAFGVPVVYHTRKKRPDVTYRCARSARAKRYRHQHGPRLRGRRAGFDQGAQGQAHHGRGPRCVCQGAARAGRADRDGQCRAVPSCRIGVRPYARHDGPACRRQYRGLGGGQTAIDAGGGNAVASLEQKLTIPAHRLHSWHVRHRHDATASAC